MAEKRWTPDGRQYQSGKVASRVENGFKMQFGRLEARVMVPAGQGMFPALWLAGGQYWKSGSSWYGDWPACGEIDVMECVNNCDQITQSIHYGAIGNHQFQDSRYGYGRSFAWSWHTYAVEWNAWSITYFVDGVRSAAYSWWWGVGPYPVPFNQPFHVIINLAVGGYWPGWIDDSIFPRFMRVDWINVYTWQGRRELMPAVNVQPQQAACTTVLPYFMWNNATVPFLVSRERIEELEAEHFDLCGHFIAIPEVARGNDTVPLRPDAPEVPLRMANSTSHGSYAALRNGDWLSYTVEVEESSTFALSIIALSDDAGGEFRVTDGDGCGADNAIFKRTNVDAVKKKKKNNKDQHFMNHGRRVNLDAGVHKLTFCVLRGNVYLDYMRFEPLGSADMGSEEWKFQEPTGCVSKGCSA
jgi:hypothetical protein